jgi:cation:H+ antiporter
MIDCLVYVLCFVVLWKSSDLIVNSVSKLAHKLKISAFSISFFILGFLTSLPEIMVGFNSVITGKPEIFVGNLLGGTLVLFIFVIPFLAVFGNGLSLKHELSKKHLIISLLVILAPAFLLLDNRAAVWEGLVLISSYAFLFFVLERGQYSATLKQDRNFHWFKDATKIFLGVILIAVSSFILVEKTVYFANLVGLSPFIISFIIVALGTNLPEIVLAFRAISSGKKDIALGDFLGSAVANCLIMGILIIINQRDILIPTNFLLQFIFLFGGIAVFYYFTRSSRNISRREGLVLLTLYIIFLVVQIWNRF